MLFLTFSVLVANPENYFFAPLHGGQWSAEQGKENEIKRLAAHPPPTPHAVRSEKINEFHATHLQALRKFRSVSRPHKDSFDSSTRSKCVASQISMLPCAITTFFTVSSTRPFPLNTLEWRTGASCERAKQN